MDRKIRLFNPWWEENKIPADLFSESYYHDYKEYDDLLRGKKIIAILGARQIGKTYVLYSIINHLFKNNVPTQNVLFLSLDDKIINLDMALSYYERIILKKKIQGSSETYYVFLDEIQLQSNWQEVLKPYIEESFPVKFILASSSSNFFDKDTISIPDEYYSEFRISPLSFREYLDVIKSPIAKVENKFSDIMNFDEIIGKRIDFLGLEQETDSALRKYLIQGGYFRYLKETNPLKKTQRIISEIIDLAIYKDINLLYNLPNARILEDILLYVARNTSEIFETEKAVRLFGGLPAPVLEKYLDYLETSFLIHSCKDFQAEVSKSPISSRKIYFADIGIRNALLGNYSLDLRDVNQIVDNVVYTHLLRIQNTYNFNLYYWKKGNYICDLVLNFENHKIPLLIYYKKRQEKSFAKNILRFFEEENIEKGIMITKDEFDLMEFESFTILKLPASYFLLCSSF